MGALQTITLNELCYHSLGSCQMIRLNSSSTPSNPVLGWRGIRRAAPPPPPMEKQEIWALLAPMLVHCVTLEKEKPSPL